jgi:hypothetical protein
VPDLFVQTVMVADAGFAVVLLEVAAIAGRPRSLIGSPQRFAKPSWAAFVRLLRAVDCGLYFIFWGSSHMKVDIPGDVQQFSSTPIGSFFKKLRTRRPEFGICVSIDGTQRAAIIFKEGAPPYLQTGGLSDVVYYEPAILRAAGFEYLHESEYGSGAVIKARENSYLRVADGGMGNYRTFDLATGLQTNLPEDVPQVLYASWRVGMMVDGDFAELFSWPPAAL